MNLDRTFLKKLWNGEKVLCPKCNKEYLVPLHNKLKKQDDKNDFKCPNCNEIYRTIGILSNLLKNNK